MRFKGVLDEGNGQLNVAINVWLSPHTGLIRLRSSPSPRLQGVKYILNVTATDDNASGGPQSLSAIAQVIVGVDDVNNNKPVFEKVQCILIIYLLYTCLYIIPMHFCLFTSYQIIHLSVRPSSHKILSYIEIII